jgi:hypothetical protein
MCAQAGLNTHINKKKSCTNKTFIKKKTHFFPNTRTVLHCLFEGKDKSKKKRKKKGCQGRL